MMKTTVRKMLASGFYAAGQFKHSLCGKVAILMYHRVLSEQDIRKQYVQPGMYVADKVFDMQMRFLKEHFNILSLNEMLSIWNEKTFDRNKRYCVITFDDGWLDNYTYAFPILKKYDISATVFLPTSFVGDTKWFWYDRLAFLLQKYAAQSHTNFDVVFSKSVIAQKIWRNYFRVDKIDPVITKWKLLDEKEVDRRLVEIAEIQKIEIPNERKIMNWQEIEEMSQHKISFGSHSTTHRILTLCDADVVQREIVDSMNVLQNKRINFINVFCYPNGSYNKEISDMVRAAGYKAAVTTTSGLEDNSPEDLFSLRRVGIHNDISSTIPLFLYQLSRNSSG